MTKMIEQYVSLFIVAFLGIIFTVLARGLVKMYERLWNEGNKKGITPDEMYRIMSEGINDALKLAADRERKRITREPATKKTLMDLPLDEEAEPGDESTEFDENVDKAFEGLKRGKGGN